MQDNNNAVINMEEGEDIQIAYIRSDAFTKCECGKDIGLHNFSGKEYTGGCICGNTYSLIDNKIRRTNIPASTPPPVSGEKVYRWVRVEDRMPSEGKHFCENIDGQLTTFTLTGSSISRITFKEQITRWLELVSASVKVAALLHFSTLDKMPTLMLLDKKGVVDHVVKIAKEYLEEVSLPVKADEDYMALAYNFTQQVENLGSEDEQPLILMKIAAWLEKKFAQ